MAADRFRARFPLWLGGLWAFALALRAVYLYEVSDSPLWLVVMGDARSYDTWARALTAGDWLGQEVFYQAPLYPYFIGAVYATLGDGPWTLRVVQCVLGATGCVLLAIAGARLATRRIGLTAGLLLAVYPPAIFFDGLIQKTTLTSFFLCALLAVTAGLATRPASLRRWCVAGALTGLLSLVRENALVLAVLAPIWIVIGFRRERRINRIAWIVAFAAGVAAMLAPVAARNGLVGGEWHLTTSQFGPNFFIGNYAEADGLYTPLLPERGDPLFERTDAISLAEEDLGRKLTPREVSRYWTREAIGDIGSDPSGWVALLFRKLWLACNAMEIIDTEDQYTYAEYSWLLSSLMSVWHMGVLLPLAMFGAVLLSPRRTWRRRLAWPCFVIVGYTASVLLFFVLGRYRFPLVPPLMLFAAAGLWQAFRLAKQRSIQVGSRVNHRRGMLHSTMPRLTAALALAAVVAVPANIFPYPVERAMAVTRENLGEHMYAVGYPPEIAIAEYDRAIALTPDNTVLRANYARILWDLERRDEAREQLEIAVRDAPDDGAALVELGLMLRDLDDFEASASRLREAVEASPDVPEPCYHLAVTLLKWSDRIGAAAAADAVSQGLASAERAGEIAADLDRVRDFRMEAAALLRRCLSLNPDSEAAHAALGSTLAKLGEATDAAAEFGEAAELAPAGSARQARHLHMQRRLIGPPTARRSVPQTFRRRNSP
ncbi:MAG: glycosyltransferase family 39 protein [Planctomycetota bacterium]|nr:glycosyltransferase family 39 protein [Planctomycetaceae bacterium]MDQ3330130.1 glycosyltransferase family 39 protein [Planctomycetota bacterium]